MKGAGGTSGGIGKFFLGLVMMCGGFYMLLNSIVVSSGFGLGMHLYSFSALGGYYGVTGGMVLIPFIIGIGMIFFSGSSILGWLLTIGSLAALLFGVISSLQVSLRVMSMFDLIVIFVLAFGGTGLFLSSLRSS
ncbi:MAG TPA: hypothetical protein VFM46_20120 [Pseudomonadales bacterium]|nr:hypothetical protein [Pseudomonadales bacterium]